MRGQHNFRRFFNQCELPPHQLGGGGKCLCLWQIEAIPDRDPDSFDQTFIIVYRLPRVTLPCNMPIHAQNMAVLTPFLSRHVVTARTCPWNGHTRCQWTKVIVWTINQRHPFEVALTRTSISSLPRPPCSQSLSLEFFRTYVLHDNNAAQTRIQTSDGGPFDAYSATEGSGNPD